MKDIQHISRPEIDDEPLCGLVLARTDVLWLIAEEDDFQFDGYRVVRAEDVSLCETTPCTWHCSAIMRGEGLLDKPPQAPDYPLEDWRGLLSGLKTAGEFVILEDEIGDAYLIGPILDVGETKVTLRYFDGAGVWEGPESMAYADITSMRFGTRYVKMHQKYIVDGKHEGAVSKAAGPSVDYRAQTVEIREDDLLIAMDDHGGMMNHIIDLKTGEVFFITEDFSVPDEDAIRESMEEDPDRYLWIDPLPSHTGFEFMEDFAAMLPEGKERETLERALERRKPFRQFKDAVHAIDGMADRWYAYHTLRMRRAAADWLESAGVDAKLV